MQVTNLDIFANKSQDVSVPNEQVFFLDLYTGVDGTKRLQTIYFK